MKPIITAVSLCLLLLTPLLVDTEPAVSKKIIADLEMITIEAGRFTMGSTQSGADYSPEHTVNISAFRMSKHEVSQKLYAEITGERPCAGSKYGAGDQLPVYNVSWYDAVGFCNRLSLACGLEPYYIITKNDIDPANVSAYDPLRWEVRVNAKAGGFRLPTEAQWEYACRAADDGAGSRGALAGDSVWFDKNSGGESHPVASKRPNAWGLCDMLGNVAEWCLDPVANDPAPVVAPMLRPAVDRMDVFRATRGGAWTCSIRDCDPGQRGRNGEFSPFPDLGFRVALVRRAEDERVDAQLQQPAPHDPEVQPQMPRLTVYIR